MPPVNAPYRPEGLLARPLYARVDASAVAHNLARLRATLPRAVASGADASGAAAPGAESASSGIDWGGGLDAIDGEGVVLLPVLALFALMLLAFTGLGSLLWLVWGSELFLAVAVEVAFALLMARSLYVMERDGWLLVALRLSWKPMLGALLSAVALGLLCDALFPEADTLAQVIKSLRGR